MSRHYKEDFPIGTKIGSWTILSPSEKKGKDRYVLCRCICNTEKQVRDTFLRTGKSASCHKCARKARRIPLNVGDTINSWTVIEIIEERPYTRCVCRCKCGHQSTISKYNLLKNKSKGCIKCGLRKYVKGVINLYWRNLVNGAKARNLEFSIDRNTIEQLLEEQKWTCALSGLPIHFADEQKVHKRGGSTASLDRIDSIKGYIPGNVQWVHKEINDMKRDRNEQEFLMICCAIANKQNQKNLNPEDIFLTV